MTHEQWVKIAYDAVVLYVNTRTKKKREFECSEIRQYVSNFGMITPNGSKEWGAVMLKAQSAGLIKRVGHNSKTNSSIWRIML